MKIARLSLPWVRMSDLGGNSRLHWRRKHSLNKNRHGMVKAIAYHEGLHLKRAMIPEGAAINITLWCCPPTGTVYPDDDNFTIAQKSARDAIAAVLGVDDSRFRMQPVQRGERSKDGGVIVEIEVAQ